MAEKKPSSRIAAFTLTIVILVIGIFLLELVSGSLLKNPSLGAKQKLLDEILDSGSSLPLQINDRPDSKVSPHPYLLYANTPNYRKQIESNSNQFEQEHNSLGYRSPETAAAKPKGVYRVLALGGSTTYGASVPRLQDAWPWLLQEQMNKNPPEGYERVEVLNGGLSAATSAELLAGWIFRHQYMEPDLVVIHTGGNDIYPLLFPEYNPEYTHLRARGLTFEIPARRLVKMLVEHSNTVRLLSLQLLPDDNLSPVFISMPFDFGKIELPVLEQRVQDTYPLGFERNLETLVRAIQLNGVPIAIASFVMAPAERIREIAPDFARNTEVLELGLRKNQKVMRTITNRYGVPYMEFTRDQLPGDYFVDWCHLTVAGEQQKATIIHEFLTTSHLWRDETIG